MIMIKPFVLSQTESFMGLTHSAAAAALLRAAQHTFSHTGAATQS